MQIAFKCANVSVCGKKISVSVLGHYLQVYYCRIIVAFCFGFGLSLFLGDEGGVGGGVQDA